MLITPLKKIEDATGVDTSNLAPQGDFIGCVFF